MSDLISKGKLLNYISEHSHYDNTRPAESYASILQAVNGFPVEDDRDKFLAEVIEYYGSNHQLGIAMEELAELIQAISKMMRGEQNTDHLIEEIADVEIMIHQLKIIFGIFDYEVDREMDFKIDRLSERMKDDTTF